MTGRMRSARAAASLALSSDPAVQPPSFMPRRLAAARPALVRCERPLLLRQRRKQVEGERVNVGAESVTTNAARGGPSSRK
jgi:hypothetical protein